MRQGCPGRQVDKPPELLFTALACAIRGGLEAALRGPHAAHSSKESAASIVEKMIDNDPLGYGGAEARIAMTLVNDRDQENLGIDDGGERTQWLYLPAIGKTRRIIGKQRNAAFVGTDYTYADMDLRDIDERLTDAWLDGGPPIPSTGLGDFKR